jgi:Holliday junction DNA helicase RuvB
MLNRKSTSDVWGEFSRRSRGTPRIANGLLRRVRDFAQVLGNGIIDMAITKHALGALNVDEHGLDEMDNRILATIIEKFSVGRSQHHLRLSVKKPARSKMYEPFDTGGFSYRTPRGRVTPKAYEHFVKKSASFGGPTLF